MVEVTGGDIGALAGATLGAPGVFIGRKVGQLVEEKVKKNNPVHAECKPILESIKQNMTDFFRTDVLSKIRTLHNEPERIVEELWDVIEQDVEKLAICEFKHRK